MVLFGDFGVSDQGVFWGGNGLGWQEIAWIASEIGPAFPVGSYRWAIHCHGGKSFKFPLQRFPNLGLLWALMKALLDEKRIAQSESASQGDDFNFG
jgi:hypothetical protein